MSRAHLKAVPDPADAIASRLREQLSRLFDGLKIKRISPFLDLEWIEVAVFGQAEDLIRHGLLTADMLKQIPPCGTKRFDPMPSLGETIPITVKRGKTGIGFSTYWYARCDANDEAWRVAPLWIRAALRELLAVKDSKQSIANQVSEIAAESKVKISSPEEWRESRLSQLCHWLSVIAKLGDPDKWRASDELDGDFDADKADVSAYTALARTAAKDLERALRSMKIRRAKTSVLKLVVNNT